MLSKHALVGWATQNNDIQYQLLWFLIGVIINDSMEFNLLHLSKGYLPIIILGLLLLTD